MIDIQLKISKLPIFSFLEFVFDFFSPWRPKIFTSAFGQNKAKMGQTWGFRPFQGPNLGLRGPKYRLGGTQVGSLGVLNAIKTI
jgi:hypothetical protein